MRRNSIEESFFNFLVSYFVLGGVDKEKEKSDLLVQWDSFLDGENNFPIKWERLMIVFLRSRAYREGRDFKGRDEIKENFPTLRLMLDLDTRNRIAQRAFSFFSFKDLRSARASLFSYLSGKIRVPLAWERFLLDELGCIDKKNCRYDYPSLFFTSDQRSVVKNKVVGSPRRVLYVKDRIRIIHVATLMIKGEELVSLEWENILLKEFECFSRDDLRKRYPLMRFYNDDKKT